VRTKPCEPELVCQRRKRRTHQELAPILDYELDKISRPGDGQNRVQPHAREFGAVANVEGERLSRRVDPRLLPQQMLDQREGGDEQWPAWDCGDTPRGETARNGFVRPKPLNWRA
jgi:hypothetical protein